MSVMLLVIGADAQNCGAGRQHAARHHEAHRGASRLLTATEKGGGVHACVHAASVYLCWPEVLNAGAAAGSRRAAEEAGGAGEEGRRAGPAGERDADAERIRRWALCRGRLASGSWSVSFRAARSLLFQAGKTTGRSCRRSSQWVPVSTTTSRWTSQSSTRRRSRSCITCGCVSGCFCPHQEWGNTCWISRVGNVSGLWCERKLFLFDCWMLLLPNPKPLTPKEPREEWKICLRSRDIWS